MALSHNEPDHQMIWRTKFVLQRQQKQVFVIKMIKLSKELPLIPTKVEAKVSKSEPTIRFCWIYEVSNMHFVLNARVFTVIPPFASTFADGHILFAQKHREEKFHN